MHLVNLSHDDFRNRKDLGLHLVDSYRAAQNVTNTNITSYITGKLNSFHYHNVTADTVFSICKELLPLAERTSNHYYLVNICRVAAETAEAGKLNI